MSAASTYARRHVGRPPVIVRVLIGTIIGALLGIASLVAWGIIQNDRVVAAGTAAPPETTTSTEPPWVAPGEATFESTVVVATSFTIEDDVATLEYELTNLAPSLPPDVEEPEHLVDDTPVLPELWELRRAVGAPIAATTGPQSTNVRFEVPAGTALDDVVDIRIVGWRAATPLGDHVELAVESGATDSLEGGTEFVVATVLVQTTSTIVQIDVDRPHGEWESLGGLVQPADHGWRTSFRDGGIQLLWEGADAPDRLTLDEWVPIWRPLGDDSVVWSGGSDR